MSTSSRRLRGTRARLLVQTHITGECLESRCMLATGILVQPVVINTSEDGGSALVRARLTRAPTADVTVGVSSSDTAEGTLSVSQLTFTPATWNRFQTFRVTGVPDGVRDGNQTYSIVTAPAASADPSFDGVDARDVMAVNRDSRRLVAGVSVSPVTGLQTSEEGKSASFRVRLTYPPTSPVTIPLESSRPTEGLPNAVGLVFTPADWNVFQTVTVTGQPDGVRDSNQSYRIVTGTTISDDPKYDGLAVKDVLLINRDSPRLVAGIAISPLNGLFTTASGGSTSFGMVLTYKPAADVTIPITSGRPSLGVPDVASLTFTPDNWSQRQVVVVTGQDAGPLNVNVRYTIVTGPAVSTDPLYNGMNPSDVSIVHRPRTDVGRFNGAYEGTFTGTASYLGITRPVQGEIRCRIVDGAITVIVPPGSGTVSGTGAVGFALAGGAVQGATFTGVFSDPTSSGMTTARGLWRSSIAGVTGSGFWNIHYVGAV